MKEKLIEINEMSVLKFLNKFMERVHNSWKPNSTSLFKFFEVDE